MKATLPNYRQSPRKVRLVATLIKGKSVTDAKTELDFLVKRAATPFGKLLDSAVANAKMQGMDPENLFIKEARVDGGVVLKRSMPRAFGRASPLKKRSSHLLIILAEKTAKQKKGKKSAAKAEEKAEKPVALSAQAGEKKAAAPKAKKPAVKKVAAKKAE